MASPIVEVKDGAVAYGSTVDGVDVTPANVIVIRLASTADVDSWSIACLTTDELSSASTVNAALVIDSVLKTATFTAPAAGRCYRFQSQVNGGRDRNNVTQSTYTTTFCIYTLAGSNRVHALDETTEGSSLIGWGETLNVLARSGGGGGGGAGVTSYTGSQDYDGNITPTADIFVISDAAGANGIFYVIADVLTTKRVAGVLTPTNGGLMRCLASWKRVAGTPTLVRRHSAAAETGGASYLLNVASPEADMDLDVAIVGATVVLRVTPSVDGEYRYQYSVEIRGPVV